MSLHYLDPSREPRGCDRCGGDGTVEAPVGPAWSDEIAVVRCRWCHGTGRLGVAGARPDVEVRFRPDARQWEAIGHFRDAYGPVLRVLSAGHSTESAALAAAREAQRATALATAGKCYNPALHTQGTCGCR